MLNQPVTDPLELAREARLRYVSDTKLKGFSRRKHGKGFSYLDKDGNTVRDPRILERLKSIYIPPAWREVWISPTANGHIQATGRDEKGRKQYVYHADWIEACQENKFNRMIQFGRNLPRIRERLEHDMASREMNKERVLATVVWLLQNTFIRIGNDEYAKTNESYGLTTITQDHVELKGNRAILEFKGKSGVMHSVDVRNPRIVRTIRRCIELPGYELFRYRDGGEYQSIDSADVNEYLREITGDEFSAKDFRTWGGTTLAADTLTDIGIYQTETECKKNITTAVKEVSKHLRNTPTVCRTYYIHPRVPGSYEDRALVDHFRKFSKTIPGLSVRETALIDLLER
jgi:DNA topoisomerase-1